MHNRYRRDHIEVYLYTGSPHLKKVNENKKKIYCLKQWIYRYYTCKLAMTLFYAIRVLGVGLISAVEKHYKKKTYGTYKC